MGAPLYPRGFVLFELFLKPQEGQSCHRRLGGYVSASFRVSGDPHQRAINKTSSTDGAAPLKAEVAGVRGIFGLGIEYHHAQRITVLSGHQSATVVS